MGGKKNRGGIQIVLNESSSRFTPNIASFDESRSAGALAKPKERSNFKNTVTHVKRLIGQKYSDPAVQRILKHVHFKTTQNEDDSVGIVVNFEGKQRTFLPEQIVAFQLANVAEYTKEFTKFPVSDMVVSVPSYFNERQRQAVLDACKISGVPIRRLVNDTTATALSYGILRKKTFSDDKVTRVMFLDMGYMIFECSIVEFTQTGMKVLGSAYDENVGGYFFDYRLAEYLNSKFMEKHKIDLREYPKSWIKLIQAASKAKVTLSPKGVDKARINLECLYKEKDFRYEVTIDELAEVTKDLIPLVKASIERCFQEANVTKADLKSCEATGGSIRMRFVKHIISDMLGSELMSYTLNQDECTARGCAIIAAMMSPKVKVQSYKIEDCVPYAVTLKWKKDSGENSLVVFKKDSSFPAEMQVTFKRTDTFTLNAVQENGDVLGSFEIDMSNAKEAVLEREKEGLKPNEVRVFVSCDQNGLVSVSSAEYMKKNKQPEPEPEPVVEKEETKTEKEESKKEGDDKNEVGFFFFSLLIQSFREPFCYDELFFTHLIRNAKCRTLSLSNCA